MYLKECDKNSVYLLVFLRIHYYDRDILYHVLGDMSWLQPDPNLRMPVLKVDLCRTGQCYRLNHSRKRLGMKIIRNQQQKWAVKPAARQVSTVGISGR